MSRQSPELELNELENIKKRCESNIIFSIKVAATDMKYFTSSKFSRSLIHKKKLSLTEVGIIFFFIFYYSLF